MLVSRIQVVVSYVEACEKGDLTMDPQIMREISSLAHRLPILDSEQFNEEFYTVSIEVGLTILFHSICQK